MSMLPERWKQIEELYSAVQDLNPEERAAILAKASSEVNEIVGRMLAEDRKGILDQPPWTNQTSTIASPGPFTSGTILGPYRIEAAIGSGGMGDVYRALDTRLARRVAIKAIRAGTDSRDIELRFLEEARAASALNHPSIVTVYDIGSFKGRPYIVMEWIEGETLREKLKQGPLALPDLLNVALRVADALAAAHEGGILHRDLKPENIMIATGGRLKVLDFGIARRIASPEDATRDIASITMPGSIMGTPGYMSPEQARGEKLDFRSDQFSFGAVLYEMATGQRAFAGNSVAEVQAAILMRQPQPLTRLNPQVPAPFQWLVERCLAKAPEDRFGSTGELPRELAAIEGRASHRLMAVPLVNNLPAPRTAFIGREDELKRLAELTASPDLRVLTLTGPGGMGKTRLAIELARRIGGGFAGGVCFVTLDRVSQASLVPSEVARALGATMLPGQSAETAIANHLEQDVAGRVLLLLDNFEHVADAAVFVAGLVSERLTIVVTSRAALRVYGEYEFLVPPLLSDTSAERSPAVELFLERAPGLRGSPRDAEQLRLVSEVCARLDGMPLAIELAAARTKLLPLPVLLERLQEPLSVLVGGARDLPERQHTLRATLDWSYKLLSGEHQALFRRMAVFVGGATIEAIEAVCDTRQDLGVNLWDALELLVDNSLVRRMSKEGEPRFTMFETMREYGLERLAEAVEDAYTRKAHAAYCLVLAEEEGSSTRREHVGKHVFDLELGNFRAALDWLTAAHEVEWGLRIVGQLWVYFNSRRLHLEMLTRLSRLLALPEVDRFPKLHNWAKYWEADLAFEAGKAEIYRPAWKIFEEAGDQEGMLIVAHRISHQSQYIDVAEARRWSELTVEMARQKGESTLLAGCLSNHADCLKVAGDFALARGLYQEAKRLFDEFGDRENAVWTLSHEADSFRQEGQPAKAQALYRQALSQFQTLKCSLGIASCLHDLAGLEAASGNLAQARQLYQKCLRLYGPENISELPRVFESMAGVAIPAGQPGHALVLLGAAAAVRERFQIATLDPSLRKEVEQRTVAAREAAGEEGSAHWMKGWQLSIQEAIAYATIGAGDETHSAT